MYKQASQLKLRFSTSIGQLSVEQLWDLSQTQLANFIKVVKKQLNKDDDDELSFLDSTRTVDVENQLRFDILKDIYLTKKKENEAKRDAAEIKAHNQKIDEMIARRKDKDLENMAIEDLEKLRK